MTVSATETETMDRALEAICMLLMPFFLLGAGDDPEKARRAVAHLIQAYHPNTTRELDLAARVVGFGAAALDNLCLSMTSPTLSDTKVLRYRSAAVSLSRSAEQCRVVLQEMQQERTDAIPAPHPIPAAAPQPRAQAQPQAPKPQAPALHSAAGQMTAGQIEKAKNDARALLAGIAKAGTAHGPGQGLTGPRLAPDADAQMALAVTAALAAHRDSTALQNPTRA